LRERYARQIEQLLDKENIEPDQAFLFVPLLYNYQDPVYKDVKFTAEENEDIELVETDEVNKGSGYKRRTRRKKRTKRTMKKTKKNYEKAKKNY
jgi:hypothetical protein